MSARTRRAVRAPAAAESEELSEPPFEDDLAEEPARTPLVRRRPGLTTVLGAGVLVAAGFVIGAQVDRHAARQSAAPSTPAGSGLRGQNGTPPGQGGTRGTGQSGAPGASATAGVTAGTVQKISGRTIYVRTANGDVVKVTLTGGTDVSVLRSGSATDLKAGTNVVVQGDQAKDGTVTATSVSQGRSSGR
ncbi:hypothetical protein [Actinoallomurus iriomotensis]|uniref:DUF5666 domain-containing protein n=1 Tax=Actinoallomurus iriomotensis TaxID=478107 RepID=A0A9W6RUI3_9ACTN|nr:hypothetical protein [Actinoallomurus iriomotensis]GLY81963.1 hypothetical protein Airi01_102300 [Actinoallomurus iriomotensis]